ncbi:cyclophilin-like fold protein [Flavobacterium soli]|uniref:cyclophilin-like fold protein n=1 Tax=Flavobacterium soli TaxID=344881 RepID=UPI0003F8DE72|nr:cyclophilin-like fold protein [Flavobacterium soli]
MKTISAFLLSLICFQLFACSKNEEVKQPENPTTISTSKMKITIGSTVFTATLYDNVTANAFKTMLPLTITMSDLNANEKFFYFSSTLPTNAASGGSIQAGDLMLYGNNCLVLFYESFNTSYSYSRIGKIDDVAELETALGAGNVTVKYELN